MHYEAGYAHGRGKQVFLLGPAVNIFYDVTTPWIDCDFKELAGVKENKDDTKRMEQQNHDIVRCRECGGSVIFKRINENEIELYHTCASVKAKGRTEGLMEVANKFRDLSQIVGQRDREMYREWATELDHMAAPTPDSDVSSNTGIRFQDQ
jgi:hypothetical protein